MERLITRRFKGESTCDKNLKKKMNIDISFYFYIK